MTDGADKSGNAATTQDESAELVRKLEPMLRPDKRPQAVEIVTTYMQKVHSGPLPAPEDFEHYERVLPGSADRIIALTEREQAHRHKQEGRLVLFEYGSRISGQFGAMFALLAMLAAVVYCATIGEPLPAAVLGGIGTIVIGILKYSSRQTGKPEPKQGQQPVRRKRK